MSDDALSHLRKIIYAYNYGSVGGITFAIKEAMNWIRDTPSQKNMLILGGITGENMNLLEYLNWSEFNVGISAFVLCGDHRTTDKICRALEFYCEDTSLHWLRQMINRDDTLFSIENKGTIWLSVNSQKTTDVPCFTGGYICD